MDLEVETGLLRAGTNPYFQLLLTTANAWIVWIDFDFIGLFQFSVLVFVTSTFWHLEGRTSVLLSCQLLKAGRRLDLARMICLAYANSPCLPYANSPFHINARSLVALNCGYHSLCSVFQSALKSLIWTISQTKCSSVILFMDMRLTKTSVGLTKLKTIACLHHTLA